MTVAVKYVIFFCDDCDLLVPVINLFQSVHPTVGVHTFSDMNGLLNQLKERLPEFILIYLIKPNDGYISIIKEIRQDVFSGSIPVYVYQALPEEGELSDLFSKI